MKSLLLILILLAMSGCALHPRLPYTPAEKILLATAIGGQVGDYISSQDAFSRGCVEGNPLMQNQGVMIVSKALIGGAAYFVSNAADTHLTRKVWLGIISAIGIGATIHNSTINCH